MNYKPILMIMFVLISLSSTITAQEDVQTLLKKAVLFEKNENLDEAVSIYLQILKISPESASVYNNLGANYFELGKYAEAISALRQSIALDPGYEKAYFNLGIVYWHLKRTDEAIPVLQKAIEINPQYMEARAKLCDVYLGSDQTEKALGCYQKLLALTPSDAQSYSNYGVALMRAGRFKEAVRVFEENTKNFPMAETFNNLGVALLELHRHKEAITALKRALELEPNNESMRYNLAIAQLSAQDKTGALEQYSFLKRTNIDLAQKLFATIYRGQIVRAK